MRKAHHNSGDHVGRSGGRVAPLRADYPVPVPADLLWGTGVCLALHRHRLSEGLEVLLPWVPEILLLWLRPHIHGRGEW